MGWFQALLILTLVVVVTSTQVGKPDTKPGSNQVTKPVVGRASRSRPRTRPRRRHLVRGEGHKVNEDDAYFRRSLGSHRSSRRRRPGRRPGHHLVRHHHRHHKWTPSDLSDEVSQSQEKKYKHARPQSRRHPRRRGKNKLQRGEASDSSDDEDDAANGRRIRPVRRRLRKLQRGEPGYTDYVEDTSDDAALYT